MRNVSDKLHYQRVIFLGFVIREDYMKKNLLSLFSIAVFTVYGSAIEASNILRDNDIPYLIHLKEKWIY